MSSLSKKLLLVLIPAIVLLIGCLVLLLMIPGQSTQKVYVEQIKSARKLAEAGDYQQAIVQYRELIESNDTQEEPYLELAEIYFTLNMKDEGFELLRTGYGKTNSEKILALLEDHGGSVTVQEAIYYSKPADKTAAVPAVNTVYTDAFANYNYQKYADTCTVKSEKMNSGVYSVEYVQYDAVFEYADSGNNKIIDSIKSKPYPYARPTSIKVNKLSTLITGVENGVSVEQLKNAGISNINVGSYDNTLGCNLLTGTYNGMKITLGCDKDGNVKGDDAYNRLEPQPGNEVAQKSTVNGKIIDAKTGKPVTSAQLTIHEGKNNPTGNTVFSEKVSGQFELELVQGDYTAEVSAEGYNTEMFDMYVSDSSYNSEFTFTISPSLASDEIRFVLEWGSTPRDLDSHLIGTYNGTPLDVNFMNKVFKSNGEIIAELDVDKTDGYGPETLTLHKSDGTFEYKVHRYSYSGLLSQSGATVKIYTSGSSTPTVVSVPPTLEGEWWTVCTIENGNVKNINGA